MVNDGSSDKTDVIIKKYIKQGLPITYFVQQNKGFAAARNKALELSKGEWIAILDHDDLWYPEKLEIQNRSIEKFPEAKLHFSNSEWFRNDGTVVRKTIEDKKFESGIIKNGFLRLLSEGCFIDTETVIIEKDTLMKCGRFNERYFYVVDYDMFLNIAREHDIYYENRVLAKWRIHPKQASQAMKETMYREYVDLFGRRLKENKNLPKNIKTEMEKVIASNRIKYAFLRLKNLNAKDFILNIGIKEIFYATVKLFERITKPIFMKMRS